MLGTTRWIRSYPSATCHSVKAGRRVGRPVAVMAKCRATSRAVEWWCRAPGQLQVGCICPAGSISAARRTRGSAPAACGWLVISAVEDVAGEAANFTLLAPRRGEAYEHSA